VADKDTSALAGAASPAAALPSRKHIATAAGALSAILPSIFCRKDVAKFEDEFDPEFANSFAAEFVVRQVVDLVVRTGAVVLTFV